MSDLELQCRCWDVLFRSVLPESATWSVLQQFHINRPFREFMTDLSKKQHLDIWVLTRPKIIAATVTKGVGEVEYSKKRSSGLY